MPRDAAPQVELDLVACMGRIAGGDRAAFKALYDATSSRLFAIALLLMRRRDAAEDVLQEVYLRVWSRAGLYDPVKGPPMPWLARITRNAAISRIVQNRVPHEDIDDHAEELVAQVASAAENMDSRASHEGGAAAAASASIANASAAKGRSRAITARRLAWSAP